MITNVLRWEYLDFHKLNTIQLYEILSLRQKVFVVEQKCPFLDADGWDLSSLDLNGDDQPVFHLMGWQDNTLIAYARIILPGIQYPNHAIGRVTIAPSFRGKGLGRQLMQEAMRQIANRYGQVPIRVSAQLYLADSLYCSLGFQRNGNIYDEDGIPHVDMVYRPVAAGKNPGHGA